MGSAQSARRIQPGGVVRPCRRPRRIFPAPRSSRPLHPSSPSPGLSGPGALGGAGGAGGGVCGGPPPGRRPAAAGRISAEAVRRDRLRDGWEGPAGKVARGGPPLSSGGGGPTLPECYSPPAAALAESRGRGSQTRRRALPPPGAPPRAGLPPPFPARVGGGVPPPRGRAGVPGGPGRPSHGATAPPPLPPPATGRAEGRGGLSPVRPGRSRAVGPGGFSARRHAAERSERTGSAAMSATHPTRLETRTKESNTCASQGLARKPPWRNEGEGPPGPRWDPEASPVRRGRTTGPSRPPRRGGGA